MHNEHAPSAIVARAEENELWEKLPGIGEFCNSLRRDVKATVKRGVKARLQTWKIARRIFTYGNSTAVQARVAILNINADGTKREGRPKQGHRLAMEALAARNYISPRSLEYWMREWGQVADRLGIKRDSSEDEFTATLRKTQKLLPEFIEDLLAPEVNPGGIGAEKDTPEETGEKIAKAILRYITDDKGRVRANAAAIKAANARLQRDGAPFDLVPHGKA